MTDGLPDPIDLRRALTDGNPVGHRSLCLVAAPHQLLNATEAKLAFSDPDAALVVLSDAYTVENFTAVTAGGSWKTIYMLEVKDDKEIASLVHHRLLRHLPMLRRLVADRVRRKRIDSLRRTVVGVKRVLLGNDLPIFRHFANSFPSASVVLLDDGTATLEINRHRRDGPATRWPVTWVEQLRAWWRATLVGLKSREVDSVTFFTTYDLRVRKGDSLVLNEYTHMRARLAEADICAEVYFLGQPLTEDFWMSAKDYFRYLRDVKRYFGDRRVVYVPHKREAEAKIEQLRVEVDMPMIRFDVPIEYALLRSPKRPAAIASFHSSALENCTTLFGSTLEAYAFYIHPEHIKGFSSTITDIYDYFRTNAADVIQVIEATPAGSDTAPGSVSGSQTESTSRSNSPIKKH